MEDKKDEYDQVFDQMVFSFASKPLIQQEVHFIHILLLRGTNISQVQAFDKLLIITAYSALKLLEAVEPYLVIIAKKERAKLILNEYKKLTLRNGKYTSEQLKLKEDFYNNFIKIK